MISQPCIIHRCSSQCMVKVHRAIKSSHYILSRNRNQCNRRSQLLLKLVSRSSHPRDQRLVAKNQVLFSNNSQKHSRNLRRNSPISHPLLTLNLCHSLTAHHHRHIHLCLLNSQHHLHMAQPRPLHQSHAVNSSCINHHLHTLLSQSHIHQCLPRLTLIVSRNRLSIITTAQNSHLYMRFHSNSSITLILIQSSTLTILR